MIKNADHITIAVRDLASAINFFALLNFKVTHNVVIEKEPFESYMSIPHVKADHVSLVLHHGDRPAVPHFEIQLLHFYNPQPQEDKNINRLDKLGYNHLCFAVENIGETIQVLKANKVKMLSDILDFNQRKLVYFEGPGGIVLELAELA